MRKVIFLKSKDQVSSAALVADRQFQFFEYTHLYEYFNDRGYWDIIRIVNEIFSGEHAQHEITEMLSVALRNNCYISKNYISFLEWAKRNGIDFDFCVYRRSPESDLTVSMIFSVAEC